MSFHKQKKICFKAKVSLTKNDKFTELRAMLKKNKIRGYLHYHKSELINVLLKRGLLPETINITTITSLPERETNQEEINPKYIFLKHTQ